MARRRVERPAPLPEGQAAPAFDVVFANSKAEKSWRLLLREDRPFAVELAAKRRAHVDPDLASPLSDEA